MPLLRHLFEAGTGIVLFKVMGTFESNVWGEGGPMPPLLGYPCRHLCNKIGKFPYIPHMPVLIPVSDKKT